MKKTAKRFSLGVRIASILTCLVVTAVGFASWLVVRPVEAVDDYGSFTVYKVDTVDVEIDVNPTSTGSDTIIFGKTDTDYDDAWVVADNVATEQLKASFKVDVAAVGESSTPNINSIISQLKISFSINENIKADLKAAIDAGYITAPTVKVGGSTKSYDVSTGAILEFLVDASAAASQSITVEVSFAWGGELDSTNPYDYFNSITDVQAEDADKAVAVLGAIYKINEDLGEGSAFTLNIDTVK
jgi:hypothetical protein